MNRKLQTNENSIWINSEQIKIIKDKEDNTDLNSYKKLKYDEFSKIIKFYRDSIENFILNNDSCNLDINDVNLKFIEYQNIFVNHLISANNITQVDSYYDICIQFIYSLLNSYQIKLAVLFADDIVKMTDS